MWNGDDDDDDDDVMIDGSTRLGYPDGVGIGYMRKGRGEYACVIPFFE